MATGTVLRNAFYLLKANVSHSLMQCCAFRFCLQQLTAYFQSAATSQDAFLFLLKNL